jgi:RNA polymerase sigma factor (sigma-70 family)
MTESDFRDFVARHRAEFNYAARNAARKDEDNARDFLQDAMMAAWIKFQNKNIAEVEEYMTLYVLKCIANGAKKWYRRAKRHEPIDEAAMAMEDLTPLIGAARMADMLDEVLAKLPPDEEQAVRVCCLAEKSLTPKQAAAVCGCSVATLYRRLERAKQKIVRYFGEAGYGYSYAG